MGKLEVTADKRQAGFTLVELAVVMIIIGLLIGGVLKGQELISNAQITSTVAQIKGLDAATSTFRDQYNAFPGDMTNAGARLPNCAADPCNSGNGNGRIDLSVGAAPATSDEGAYYFNQLYAADLITTMDGTNELVFGRAIPAASIGGGYFIGHAQIGTTNFDQTELRPAHYLVLNGTTASVAAGTGAVTPGQAARIDRKMDDGIPDTGGVVSDNVNATCRDAANGIYSEATVDVLCSLAIRIQG